MEGWRGKQVVWMCPCLVRRVKPSPFANTAVCLSLCFMVVFRFSVASLFPVSFTHMYVTPLSPGIGTDVLFLSVPVSHHGEIKSEEHSWQKLGNLSATWRTLTNCFVRICREAPSKSSRTFQEQEVSREESLRRNLFLSNTKRNVVWKENSGN